ncbi:MAG: LemA family protein [Desulfomonilaceae bacterium]
MPSQQFSKNSIRDDLSLERSALNYARMIELLVAAVFLFLFFSAMSFVFLRPALQEGRANVQREWNEFLSEMRARNDMLPGLLETVKMFQPFFSKTAAKMLEAKAVIKRSRDPDVIMASVDQLDVDIKTLETLVHSNPEMLQHPTFLRQWDLFLKKNSKVSLTRTRYNSSVQTYNDLIEVFPQSIFASMFGYVRAAAYPPPPSITE